MDSGGDWMAADGNPLALWHYRHFAQGCDAIFQRGMRAE